MVGALTSLLQQQQLPPPPPQQQLQQPPQPSAHALNNDDTFLGGPSCTTDETTDVLMRVNELYQNVYIQVPADMSLTEVLTVTKDTRVKFIRVSGSNPENCVITYPLPNNFTSSGVSWTETTVPLVRLRRIQNLTPPCQAGFRSNGTPPVQGLLP